MNSGKVAPSPGRGGDFPMSAAPAKANKLFKSRDLIYQDAVEGRRFDAAYFAMLILSCLIALMGLLLNSPAVIIGAMLISPLMGPILACGLALTTAEGSLGRKSAKNLLLSVAEVVLIAIIATRLSPLREATPEILARTNPNLMDLLIAFFSGIAGTIAMSSKKTAFTILPGVAIATAVMPPLAIMGYGLGTRQWAIARGASMLFLTNFTAIVLSASLIFLVVGFRPRMEQVEPGHQWLIRSRIAIATLLLLIISIPLMRTLISAAEQVNLRGQVQKSLKQDIQRRGDRQLSSVNVELDGATVYVHAIVQTEQFINASEINELQLAVEKQIGRPVQLQVQQLQLARKTPTAEQTMHDFIAAGLVQPAPDDRPPSPAVAIETLQQHIESLLRSLVQPAGITLQVTSLGKETDGRIVVNVSSQSGKLTSADLWNVAAAGLSGQIGAPVTISATVAAIGTSLDVAYHAKRVRPTAAELRRIQRFKTSLPDDVMIALVFSAGVAPGLATKRVAVLRQVLSPKVTVDSALKPPSLTNAVAIIPVQRIKAESLAAERREAIATPHP